MTLISIRLPEKILNEADQHAKSMRVHRAEYICRAIEHWNQETHSHHNHAKRHILRTSLRIKEDRLPATTESSLLEMDLKS
jgi:metal-responsive CopG/Arc/MetJ family transcriptional regulator